MATLKMIKMVLGSVNTNCYLLYNADTKETLIVDPADSAPAIEKKCHENGLKPVAILLTHGHFDHILACSQLKGKFGINIYAHEDEAELLADGELNLSENWMGLCKVVPDVLLKDNQILELAGFEIKVIHTPGHTKGGVCYYFEDNKILMSGDTLFLESFGRTDFPGSSTRDIVRSICQKLLVLPDDVKVYPGHDDPTTIGYEKQYNPVARYMD